MLLLCLAPLLLLVLPVRAQLSDDRFEAYTSMRQINRVLVHQDAVWAGTSGGVLRYDQQTQSYARFTRRDGLPGNLILSLAVDANGHLWFGTHSQGLSRYRPEEDRFDSPFLDFQNLRINALEPHGDILYVGSERGVSAFVISKEEVKETYRRLGSLAKDTEVTSIEVFADRLWAGTVNGLVWADLDQPNLQDPSSWELELTRGEVRDMLVYQDTLFVAASNGIWRVHPALDRPEIDYSATRSVALGLFEGSIVSATTDGLLFQRQGVDHWQPLRAPHIRSAADLSDTDGPLWVASASGLRVLGTDQPPPPREPVGNFFFDMAQTPNGHLWVASVPKDNLRAFAFGLYEFDGDGWTTHNTNTNLSSNIVSALETDAEVCCGSALGAGALTYALPMASGRTSMPTTRPRRYRRQYLCRHQRHRPRRQRLAVDRQRPQWASLHGWVAAPTGHTQQSVEFRHVRGTGHDQNRHWFRRPEVGRDGERRLFPLRRWRDPLRPATRSASPSTRLRIQPD